MRECRLCAPLCHPQQARAGRAEGFRPAEGKFLYCYHPHGIFAYGLLALVFPKTCAIPTNAEPLFPPPAALAGASAVHVVFLCRSGVAAHRPRRTLVAVASALLHVRSCCLLGTA